MMMKKKTSTFSFATQIVTEHIKKKRAPTRNLEEHQTAQWTAEELEKHVHNFFLICIVGGGIKVHSTLRPLNGLLCQPRVIMIMKKSVE
jgi:hypothetical protein